MVRFKIFCGSARKCRRREVFFGLGFQRTTGTYLVSSFASRSPHPIPYHTLRFHQQAAEALFSTGTLCTGDYEL